MRRGYFIFSAIFFLSGAASLIYQVIWMKEMSLFFGSDIYASSITLAAFMGGLSLGALVASKFTDRIKHHILLYGFLEIFIGLYALMFKPMLSWFDPLLSEIYVSYAENDPLIYQSVRFVIASVFLLIPTTFMGATLPLIIKAFTLKMSELGQTTAHFYAINTLGALTGVFIAGFVLMAYLGVAGTTYSAVSLNIFLGLVCIILYKTTFYNRSVSKNLEIETADIESESSTTPNDVKRRYVVMMAITISGFGGLGLEVIWTRVLMQSFSATVYSFSMMLVAFLLGIALGSKAIESRLKSSIDATRVLAKIQIAIALSIAILACLTFLISPLFGLLVWGLSAISPGLFGFGSVLGALLVSSIFVLPTTVLLGASFPAALKAYNVNFKDTGQDSGYILFVNTFGSVVGAIVTGLFIIPVVGSFSALVMLCIIFLINGIFVLRNVPQSFSIRKVLPLVAVIFVFVIIAFSIPRQVVLNYNVQQNKHPDVVYHSEGVMGYIDIIRNDNSETVLSINGNIEADNSLNQLRHFVLKAHLPLLVNEGATDVLVVGLGLGITTSSLLKHEQIKRVDVVELSPDIVKAQAYLKDVNDDVLSDSRIHLRIDDGRNYLKFTDRKYDLITADPIHPRISGVGVLYTEEYYRLIIEKLKDDGYVLQWMPMYSISKESFDIAVRTMAKVFHNTTMWYVPGHALLLGSKSAGEIMIDYNFLEQQMSKHDIKADLGRIGIDDPVGLLKLQVLSSGDLGRYLENDWNRINTEDMPYMEYRTPFEFLGKPVDILDALSKHWNGSEVRVKNIPEGLFEELVVEQTEYKKEVTSPISEPE